MSLAQFLTILRARAGLVILVAAIVLVPAAVIVLSLPARYDAEASVLVDPMSSDAASSSRNNPAATQADIIAGYGVATRVVKALDLAHRPEAIRVIAGEGMLHRLRALIGKLLPGSEREQSSLDDWLAVQLLKKLRVHTSSDSRVVKVVYSSPDPRFAAEVANAFVKAYLRSTAQAGTVPAERTAELFQRQVETLQKRLQQAEQRVSEFERKTGIVSAGQGLDAESARLAGLSSELVRAQSQNYGAEAKQRQLRRFIDGGAPESAAPPEVMSSPGVQASAQQVAQARADVNALARRVGPNHPLYVEAEAKLERARAAYRQEMLDAARGLLASAGSAGDEAAALRSAVRQQRQKVLSMKKAQAQLSVLQSDADNARQAYEAAAKRLAETRMQGDAAQNASATLLDAATPPLRPAGPRLALILSGALLVALGLGVGAALWAETTDRRVRSPLDIDELLELPVLAVLVRRPQRGRGIPRLPGPRAPRLTG